MLVFLLTNSSARTETNSYWPISAQCPALSPGPGTQLMPNNTWVSWSSGRNGVKRWSRLESLLPVLLKILVERKKLGVIRLRYLTVRWVHYPWQTFPLTHILGFGLVGQTSCPPFRHSQPHSFPASSLVPGARNHLYSWLSRSQRPFAVITYGLFYGLHTRLEACIQANPHQNHPLPHTLPNKSNLFLKDP